MFCNEVIWRMIVVDLAVFLVTIEIFFVDFFCSFKNLL